MSPDPAIALRAELQYDIGSPSSFAFAVTAARTPRQTLGHEEIVVEPSIPFTVDEYGEGGTHQLIRLDAPTGPLTLRYRATAEIHSRSDNPTDLDEVGFGDIPANVLPYLNPSRYCESDTLNGLANRLFGATEPGYARVQEVNDWVRTNLLYEAGTTDGSTGTSDVLVQRAGVCRDFAHVAISLCRALGIPARYVSGYGLGVEPQDFHGFFEAHLSGDWWLFDPTGMASVDRLVRIGYGRDAADASFATFVGNATLVSKIVEVEMVSPSSENGEGGSIDVEDDTATSTA